MSCVHEVQTQFETIPQSKAGLHDADTPTAVVIKNVKQVVHMSANTVVQWFGLRGLCPANNKASKRAGSVN